MEILFNIFKLCAGIGLFLFAMYLLEESLKNLSGRNFKIFLQRISKNKLGAVTGGAIVTGVLQSSTLVSLMVLAFVGAGVFTMKNAMAIILGANLGTTLDSWLVATLGFKVNIEIAAYPAVCIGGLLLIMSGSRKAIKYLSFFLLGFGLLFIGLSFMKTAMEVQVKEFDLSNYVNMPLVVFLLIGFIITLVVQSSSVTMALTLSALHAGAIGFAPAVAIVLGSETGTTIKLMLSATGGSASKKRVALGNFLFNVFLTVFTFIWLKPILFLITGIFAINDPLIGLVTFSSLTNLLGIAIFLPLLNPFAKFLERFFKDSDESAAVFIGNANIAETETSLDLFRREIDYFIFSSMLYNLSMFEVDIKLLQDRPDFNTIINKRKFLSQTSEEKYEYLKQLQGELQAFYLKLRNELHEEQLSQVNQLISSVRSSMYSVKSMKDIGNNIANLRRSSKDIKFDFFMHYKRIIEKLYVQLNEILSVADKESLKNLQHLYNDILNNYSFALNNFYKEAQYASIEEIDITIVLNFNRELFTSNKAILMAIKDFLLKEKEATDFNEILVHKT